MAGGATDIGIYSRSISTSIYTRKALIAAQEAFRPYCKVTTERQDGDRLQISVRPVDVPAEQIAEMILSFWNYYLDKSLQEKLA